MPIFVSEDRKTAVSTLIIYGLSLPEQEGQRPPGGLACYSRFMIFGLAAAFFFIVFFGQSLQSPYPRNGDWWTEMDYIAGAKGLAQDGFFSLYFAPPTDNGHTLGLHPVFLSDARHPVGTALMAASLFKANWSLAWIRIAPLLFATASIVVYYFFLRRVIGEWQIPLLSSLSLVLLPPFWLLSDHLYYFAYDFALTSLFYLLIASATLAARTVSRRFLLAALVIGFIETAFISSEPAFAMGAFSFLFPLFFGEGAIPARLLRAMLFAVFVGFAFAIALCTRFGHLALIHGSLADAAQNFFQQVRIRTVGVEGREMPFPGHQIYFMSMLQRLWEYMPIHVVAILIGLGLQGLRNLPAKITKLVLVLGLSEFFYYAVMKQHSLQHAYTLYHVVFSVALLTGISLMSIVGFLASYPYPSKLRHIASKCAVMLCLGMFAFFALVCGPLKTVPNLDFKKDWTQWIDESNKIAAAIPENGILVVSIEQPFTKDRADPAYAYFIGRPFVCRGVWTPQQFRSLGTRGRPLYVLAASKHPETETLRDQFEPIGVFYRGRESLELFHIPVGAAIGQEEYDKTLK
jgi:hypothetical protein